VVIDLGEVPRTSRTEPAAAAAVPWRAVLAAVSLLLTGLLAGATPRVPAAPPVVIPARLADTTYVDGDRLFVAGTGDLSDGSALSKREIRGYRLPDARPAGRTTVAAAGAVVDVRQDGDTLVVAYQLDSSGIQAVVAQTVPGLAGRATGLNWPVGDLFLIDTGGPGLDGYRLPGLEHAWRTTADLSQSWMQSGCGRLICTFHRQRGMTVLDPADGRLLWRSDRWMYAEPSGRYLLATSGDQDSDVPPLWVLDPATGRVLGDFGRWQGLGPAGHGLLYGKRDATGEHQVWYALLDPATRGVRVLGSADRVSGGCETAAGTLICRLVDASVAVWRLG